jgi:hypothetical protein
LGRSRGWGIRFSFRIQITKLFHNKEPRPRQENLPPPIELVPDRGSRRSFFVFSFYKSSFVFLPLRVPW